MEFTVQYTRFFEEFGCVDIDTKVFDSLEDAYSFYQEHKDGADTQLWQGVVGCENCVRLH